MNEIKPEGFVTKATTWWKAQTPTTRKAIAISSGVVIVAALITSQAKDTEPVAEVSPTVPAVTAEPVEEAPALSESEMNDVTFKSLVSVLDFDEKGVTAASEVAHIACGTLDEGYDFLTVVLMLIEAGESEGVDPSTVGTILGAGITSYCPQHQAAADDFMADN
jgi:hypothetical protein